MSYASCVKTRRLHLTIALAILLALWVCGCAHRDTESIDLRQWRRVDTLWTGSSGHAVALYDDSAFTFDKAQVVVCEATPARTLIRLPPDTFPLVSKDTLNIFRLVDRSTPGWYRLTRTHGLTWWKRIFTEKSLGEEQWVPNQSSLPIPPQVQSSNGLLVLERGRFRRIADEDKMTSLF